MDNKWKDMLSTKRAFVLLGLLVLICAAGIVLMSKRLQPENVFSGDANSVPVVVDENSPRSFGGDADNQDDKYGIRLKLSNGQSQPQTLEVVPLATGQPLSPEEIESIVYTYVTRATTPGTFIAPPARAEEMYSPEVSGRSGSDWVIIK